MSAGMPEIGSKISLISKADIRYEGELYTVDPQECTIALSNVRSFGTEDREAKCPVPAQNQIYDFILFRGSDIKDIRVVQSQPMPPNDPAIVQHQISHPPPSVAPGGYPGISQPPQQHSYSHHIGGAAPGSHLMGAIGSGAPQHHNHPSVSAGSVVGSGGYNPMSGMSGMTFTPTPHKTTSQVSQQPPPPSGVHPHQGGPPHLQQHHQQQRHDSMSQQPPHNQSSMSNNNQNPSNSDLMIGSLSRSSTPAPRKSPTLDQGFHQSGGHRNDNRSGGVGMSRAVQRPQSRQSRSRDRMNNHQGGGGGGSGHHAGGQNLTFRDRNDFYDRQEMRHEFRDYRDNHNNHNNRGRDNYRDGYRLNHNQHQRGWNHHNQRQRSLSGGRRPRPRSRGPGGFGSGNRPGYQQGKSKNTLKFDGDYDFDKANTEFNELLTKLNETKIDDGTAVVNGGGVSSVGANAADTDPKKDDSGNETGVGENDHDDDKFYDKTKSFFDNISCEAVERSKGVFQRPDWRQERKMNSETFGVAATRRGGGGGGYRGRGGGGFYYQRGYNNRNYNNRNSMNNPHQRNNYNQRNNNQRYNNSSRQHNDNNLTQGPDSNKTTAAVVAATPVVASEGN